MGIEEPPDDVWRPRIMVRNKIGDAIVEEHPVRIVDAAAGRVMGAIFFEGVVSIVLELRSFPFDACAVTLFIDQGESEFEHSDAYSLVLTRGGGGDSSAAATSEQGGKSRVAIFGALPGRDAEVSAFTFFSRRMRFRPPPLPLPESCTSCSPSPALECPPDAMASPVFSRVGAAAAAFISTTSVSSFLTCSSSSLS